MKQIDVRVEVVIATSHDDKTKDLTCVELALALQRQRYGNLN